MVLGKGKGYFTSVEMKEDQTLILDYVFHYRFGSVPINEVQEVIKKFWMGVIDVAISESELESKFNHRKWVEIRIHVGKVKNLDKDFEIDLKYNEKALTELCKKGLRSILPAGCCIDMNDPGYVTDRNGNEVKLFKTDDGWSIKEK